MKLVNKKLLMIARVLIIVLSTTNYLAQSLDNGFRATDIDTSNKPSVESLMDEIIEINDKLQLDPDNEKLLAQLGNLYLERGLVLEAEKFFEKAYEIDSGSVENSINLVKVNFLQGNLEVAEMLLLQLELSYPNNFEMLSNLGQVYLVSGQVKKSEEYFKKAEAVNSNNYDVLNSLGFIYQNTGRIELAKKYWYNLIDLYPDDELALINLGILHGSKNEINEAVIFFSKAKQKNPSNKEIYYNLGILYLNNNLFDEAQYNFEKVIEYDENSPEAYFALVLLHTDQTDFKSALKVANKLSVLNYNYPQLHLAISLINYLEEDYEEAIRQAQIEISNYPDVPEPMILLGSLYREIGDKENEVKIGAEIKKKYNISLDDIGDIGTGLLTNKLKLQN